MDLNNLDWSHRLSEVADQIRSYPLDDSETRALLVFLLRRVAYLEDRVAKLAMIE